MAAAATNAVVVGVGARAANGLTALQVAMSVRAQRMVVGETRFRDKNGDPIGVCHLGSIDPEATWGERLAALARPALLQATFAWRAARPDGALPVLVGFAERERPGFDAYVERNLLSTLEASTGVRIDHGRSRVFAGGRASGADALLRGVELLHAGCPAVVLGGVDSYYDPDALEFLDAELRLHSLETENGFVPGEGAAFVLLCRPDAAQTMRPLARILGVATAEEPHPFGSHEPCIGTGATLALREALAAAAVSPGGIMASASDVQNERHRVEEWSFARARSHEAFASDATEAQPLLVTGDVGGASLAMLVAWCTTSWQAAAWRPQTACLGVHADGSPRGVAVVANLGGA